MVEWFEVLEMDARELIEITPSLPDGTDNSAIGQIVAYSLEICIDSDAALEMAGEVRASVVRHIKQIEEACKHQTRPIDEAKARIMEFFGRPKRRLQEALERINEEILRYTERVRRQHELELSRAEDQARKERERLEEEAIQARARGDVETSESLSEMAATVSAFDFVQAAPVKRKARAVAMREDWTAEIYDLKMLARAVADGVVAEMYIEPAIVALNKLARAQKSAMSIPGVRAVKRQVLVTPRRTS